MRMLRASPYQSSVLVNVGNDQAEEIYSYTNLLDFLNQESLDEETGEQFFWFKDIIAHQGPSKPSDQACKGSMWNVMVAWEDGSETYEPLHLISKDSLVIIAQYGKEHNLLDKPGWKHFKRLTNHDQKMIRMITQAHLAIVSFTNMVTKFLVLLKRWLN